ncbi:MAG: EcsC family protein [Blastochloris sp.]|nr:EcsC family protein [Blastochloris sp.]
MRNSLSKEPGCDTKVKSKAECSDQILVSTSFLKAKNLCVRPIVKAPDTNTALKLTEWITDRAIQGVPPLCSAENLALEYKIDASYPDDEERIEALINWETTKNFTSGFITGLGGLITLPVAIPAAFGASWILQARMAAAIAKLSGHDLKSDRVRTFVLICLAGEAGKEVVKEVGIKIGKGLTESAIRGVSGRALIEINKRVGFRLLTKAGEKGVLNLSKMVPLAGGLVGGIFDAGACRIVGKQAKDLFYSK